MPLQPSEAWRPPTQSVPSDRPDAQSVIPRRLRSRVRETATPPVALRTGKASDRPTLLVRRSMGDEKHREQGLLWVKPRHSILAAECPLSADCVEKPGALTAATAVGC